MLMLISQITTFTKSGVQDWLLQRITATIIVGYFTFLTYFIYKSAPLEYQVWVNLFQQTWMQWFTIITMTSIVIHAWIGIWTVTTDYLHNLVIRLFTQLATMLVLFFYLIWTLEIIWSIK